MMETPNVYGLTPDTASATCESACERLPESAAIEPSSTSGHDAPSGQLADVLPADAALFERAREAVSAIRGKGRHQNGQAGAGNTIALKTGLRSTALLNAPDVAVWHAEAVAAITADLGGDSELTQLGRASVREVARLEVIAAALGQELLAHGVLTGKGKTRAATRVYLSVLDRFTKLSQHLGLARKAKTIPSISEYLARSGGDAA